MSLTGQQLGHYRVAAKLGEGGMGVVYRAHDTRLGRDVAIKVLPDSVARDPERLARFEREARILAALNHPNIAAVYGVEQGALVMELVEGETLKGPLPLETAINYARQIADALEAAHERGIIHRDLKPANIKITPEGKVKLLDFGLAKAMEPAQGTIPESAPTLTAHASLSGIIVGTPAYMSPEQARGTRVDHRTDIWAFGVVLYEMVTGKRLFDGPTVSDVMAAVLTKDPPLDAAPAQLRPLLTRCLERDPHKRLGWIGDADWRSDAQPRGDPGWPRWAIVAIASAAALVGGAAVYLLRPSATPIDPIPRAFSFAPDFLATTDFAHRAVISPNGRYIAFVAQNKLWIRELANEQARAVEGAENAVGPFWSPDSSHVAFSAGLQLKKAAVVGGVPSVLAQLGAGYRGGAWSPDGGTIVVSMSTTGLFELPATGGPLEKRVSASVEGGTFFNPQFLPAGPGEQLLIAAQGTRFRQALKLIDLRSGKIQALRDGGYPVWSATGHILFQPAVGRRGVWALPFSPAKRASTGEAAPLLEQGSDFSVSEEGTLLWVDFLEGTRRLAWYDRSGRRIATLSAAQSGLTDITLSPDGSRAAYTASEQGNDDVWTLDLARSVPSRVTFGPEANLIPRWSPSGKELAFSSMRSGRAEIFIQPADGAREAKVVAPGPRPDHPQAWTPDGNVLLITRIVPGTGLDLLTIRRQADGSYGEPTPWLQTNFGEYNGSFSPDGRFVVYTSSESGHAEINVRSFPAGDDKRQISNGGGEYGRWSRNGKEIFFVQGTTLHAVPVGPGGVSMGAPKLLFTLPVLGGMDTRYTYDVAADGSRILLGEPVDAEAARPTAIHVVENWPALLRKK